MVAVCILLITTTIIYALVIRVISVDMNGGRKEKTGMERGRKGNVDMEKQVTCISEGN